MKNTSNSYHKIASHEVKSDKIDEVLLLYSGGLDTSVILCWLQEQYGAKVTTLTIDIGQLADDLEAVRQKALRHGAKEAILLDCRQEFCRDYISPAIKANASYQGDYHLSTPIARPLIAKKAVEIARQKGIKAIAHGATGKGNDQVRFESSILCEDPSMLIIAPIREWSMGREEEIAYAKAHGIEVKKASTGVAYSWDDNLWGVTGEGAEIEDPSLEPKLAEILQITTLPENAPNSARYVTLEFDRGLPIALDGEKLSLIELIQKLHIMAGEHGVGFTTLIEDRLVGLKVRGVYESPAGHVIITAHYNLEKIVSTQTENEFKELIDKKWAYLCYNAKWYEPTMSHLMAYINDMNQKVTGSVKLKLFKGKCDVVSVDSPYSLFDLNLATFEKNAKFNQNSSAGFIEIYSLAMKTARQIHLKE